MSKRFLLVALTLLSAAALGSSVGCGSNSSSDNGDDEGTGGAGGGGGKSGKGGGGGSSGGSSSTAGGAGQSKGTGGSSGGSSKGTGGSSGGGAAGSKDAPTCSASAKDTKLIDNMSATDGVKIAFAPTYTPKDCADTGTWFDYNSEGGTITPSGKFTFTTLPSDPGSGPAPSSEAGTPQTDASVGSDAGTDAQTTAPDATAADANTADVHAEAQTSSEGGSSGTDGGAATGLKGACIKGTTGPAQYATSGMGLNFATVKNSASNGGDDLPATIDASMYTGLRFQVYGGLATDQTVIVMAPDKAETKGYNVCDPSNTGATACGGASASVAVKQGWQSLDVPFSTIKLNKYYGGGNETAFDPSAITQLQWQVQQASSTATAGVAFDFCVYDVEFYK